MPIGRIQKDKLKALGKRVKSIRKEKNLTLKQLSNSISKDAQSIHRLETGDVNPSYLYLLEVCEGLEIKIEDLLKDL